MSDDQLNGWKEIAAYLGKSTRAAQRWERDLALPVRRIATAKGGEIVYALKSEVEAWKLDAGARRAASAESAPDALGELPANVLDADGPPLSTPASGALQSGPFAEQVSPRARITPWGWLAVAVGVLGLAYAVASANRYLSRAEDAGRSELQRYLGSDGPAGLDPGPWTSFGHDSQHTNRTPRFLGPEHPSVARLLFDTHAAGSKAAFAVASNGTILVGSCGAITAIDSTGTVVWKKSLERRGYAEEPAGFAIDSSGRIFFPTAECPDTLDAVRLGTYALLPSGEVYWHRQHGSAHIPPTIAPDGTVYTFDETDTIHALAPDGSQRWATDLPGYSQGLISLDGDGTLIVGNDGGWFNMTSFWRIDHRGGRPLFTAQTGSLSTPLIVPDGTVVVGDHEGTLWALARSGEVLWRRDLGSPMNTMPLALGLTGLWARSAGALTKFDVKGSQLWQVDSRMLTGTPEGPVVDRVDNLYLFDDVSVFSLTPLGRPRWRLALSGVQHLAVGGDQLLYAFGGGQVYVISDY